METRLLAQAERTGEAWPFGDDLQPASYRALLVDPPWYFRTRTGFVSDRDPRRHYRVMTLTDLCALPVGDLAHPDGAHLFLWATGPCLEQAFALIKAWGFRYSGIGFAWIKLKKSHDPNQLRVLPSADGDFHVGLGFTTRKNMELVLLARRGNAKRISKKVRELVLAPRRAHSQKPDEVQARIQEYCAGPYAELFARRRLPNWDGWGDQIEEMTP